MIYGITGNKNKKNIPDILSILLKHFERINVSFLLDDDLKVHLEKNITPACTCKREKVLKNSDIIISLGGDGTFLNTARLVGSSGKPILGVNLGTLGFIAEVSPNEVIKFIDDIEKGKYKVVDLCVLSLKAPSGKELNGINEITIDKESSIRIIEIEVKYKNEFVANFLADGLIVSTPTGSTGYSLSAGGPIVSPYSKVFIINPICPHSLNLRPIIVPDDGVLTIKASGSNKIRVSADGHSALILDSPSEFIVSKAEYNIRVVKRMNKTYFQTLNNKLLWGEDKRKK